MTDHATPFSAFISRKRAQYGSNFDDSNLNPAFISAFNRAPMRRVRVKFPWPGPDGNPEIVWGFVSVTTGWRPTFILMRRLGQRGSSLIIDRDCEILQHRDK